MDMILYFSGTGNSAYVARRIGRETGDEVVDLFERIREGDHTPLSSERPCVLVTPTYAWRIPRIVQSWLKRTPLTGSRAIYFVMTCGENIGNAGEYLRRFCSDKKLEYRGCAAVVMPENYIAMFPVPGPEEAEQIIRQAAGNIDRAAALIREGRAFPDIGSGFVDRLESGIVNSLFYPFCVYAGAFRSTDACIFCGKCVQVCPLKNVRLVDGRPVWGKNCTHCMACICRCPREAIEYGNRSRGKPRYVFPDSIGE